MNLRTLLAAIFCCYAVLFMVGSILFLYRKSILRRLNNDRIIKKTIALSLLDVEHPLDYITIPKTELNNKQYIQKRSEEAFNEHFSRLKKPSRLTRSDYKKIKELYISNPDLYNISLLSKLTNLEELQFYNVKVGNLEPIANLTNLKELRLYEMPISDIEPLGNLKNLEEIRMYDVNVRNLDVLFNLKNLKVLWLLYVPVSDEQVEELQKALPDLEIDFRGKSSVQH
jgi:Leucine-rich repeat (LRR) protein